MRDTQVIACHNNFYNFPFLCPISTNTHSTSRHTVLAWAESVVIVSKWNCRHPNMTGCNLRIVVTRNDVSNSHCTSNGNVSFPRKTALPQLPVRKRKLWNLNSAELLLWRTAKFQNIKSNCQRCYNNVVMCYVIASCILRRIISQWGCLLWVVLRRQLHWKIKTKRYSNLWRNRFWGKLIITFQKLSDFPGLVPLLQKNLLRTA